MPSFPTGHSCQLIHQLVIILLVLFPIGPMAGEQVFAKQARGNVPTTRLSMRMLRHGIYGIGSQAGVVLWHPTRVPTLRSLVQILRSHLFHHKSQEYPLSLMQMSAEE